MKYFLLILLVVVSCSSPNSPALSILSGDREIMKVGENLLPLSVGNVWEYEYNYSRNDTLVRKGVRKWEVTQQEELEFSDHISSFYQIDFTGADGNIPNPYAAGFYKEDQEGIFFYGWKDNRSLNIFENRQAIIKYPVELYHEWNYQDIEDITVSNIYESLDEEINLNGNLYSSVKVKIIRDESYYEIVNFVRGIGNVGRRLVHIFQGNTYIHEMKLINNVLY